MITLQEFKNELIPVNLHTPVRREEYFKIYCQDSNITEYYNQLMECDTFG